MKKTKTGAIRKVSVVLPTYNEVENIVPLIKAINKNVSYPKEIIVVDDNSPDQTSKAVKNYVRKSKVKNVRLETRYKNRGLTNSIKRGIELAKGDTVVWMDCDFSMPPILIDKLLQKIDQGYDISVGSRFIKGGGFKKSKSGGQTDSPLAIILSRLMNYAIQAMLGGSFKDYTSGFIAIRKRVFDKVKMRGDYGEYFIDLIYKSRLLNYKIIETGYFCLPREKGQSKTGQNIGQFAKRGSKYILLTSQLLLERHILHKLP